MVLNPRCEIWKYFDNIIEEGVAVCKLCNQRLKNDRSYSLKKHINKLHNPKSEVWNYFSNVVEECVAVCKICQKRVRNNRHFNLMLHLRQHDIGINQSQTTKSYKKQPETKRQEQVKVLLNGYLCIEMKKKTLADAVMGLMIEESIAPQIFGSKNMQALLSPICEAISKQEDIKFKVDEIKSERVLVSVANHIHNEFCNDLHRRLMSVKIDNDLNTNSKSFCVNVQFIDEDQLQTRTLGVITLRKEQHLTGEHIMEILQQFRIDDKQIVSACWDNSKENFNHLVLNSQYLKEIEQFERTYDIYVGNIKIENYIGVIAQLCVLDTLRSRSVFKMFLECRNLTKFINDQPSLFREEFAKHNLNIPQLDSPWKWGSSYTMMNELKLAWSMLIKIDCKQPDHIEDQFSLNDNLRNFIENFCKSLNFIQKTMQKFYNEEMIFGDFYAKWLKCKLLTERLQNANINEGNYLEDILSELLKSIENRSNKLLNLDRFKACLYLDPRFQHTLNLPEKIFAIEYLKQLWECLKVYNTELVDPVTESQQQTTVAKQQIVGCDDDDDDAFLNEFLSQGVKDAESTGIYKKLENLKLPFKMVDTNILSFWNEIKSSEPEIYTLSTICFSMPATQQMYNKSQYSHFKSEGHTANIPQHIKRCVTFIRLNEHLLDKVKGQLWLFREDDMEQSENDNETRRAVFCVSSSTMSAVHHSHPSTSADGFLTNTIVKSEVDNTS